VNAAGERAGSETLATAIRLRETALDEISTMKPTDVFIGAVELFAIIIPGAIAAFAFEPYYSALGLVGTRGWVAFLIGAYTLGHIGYYLSGAIDDFWLVKKETDKAVAEFRGDSTDKGTDSYKNAKAYLAVHCPATLAGVLRSEADSKFFRSLLIVLPFFLFISGVVWAHRDWAQSPNVVPAALSPLLWIMSFFLYRTLRVKAIKGALRLERMHRVSKGRKTTKRSTGALQPTEPEHPPVP